MAARAEDISFSTYERPLFEDLSLLVKSGEVTAVTGKSGSGKTVLLKMLAGMEVPQGGTLDVTADRVAFMPQEVELLEVDEDITIGNLFKKVRGLDELEKQIADFNDRLAEHPDEFEKFSGEYGEAMQRYEQLGGYEAETEIELITRGLGVDRESTGHISLETKLSEVSSGQKRRLLIGRALYARPDMLLLDDPTVHLDVDAVDYLADFLKKSDSTVVIASNDARFIDRTADQTLGLTDFGRTFVFRGGYTDFVEKRDAKIESEQSEARSVKRKVDQLEETDRMFRSKHAYARSSDMAQVGRSLGTRIDKLKSRHEALPGSKDVYEKEKVRDLKFSCRRRSGESVVTIDRIKKSYGEFVALDLSEQEGIHVRRGEQWLIWGPNGSGKSTLLRMIADNYHGGEFIEDAGVMKIGPNVDLAYAAPDVIHVGTEGTILEDVQRGFPGAKPGKLVATLRFFGFRGAAIHNQEVSTLSFGEKRRLTLVNIMLAEPNVLVLDEPTGDFLTDELKERLASALARYDGTLVVVSHDRHFIDQLKISHTLTLPSGSVSKH